MVRGAEYDDDYGAEVEVVAIAGVSCLPAAWAKSPIFLITFCIMLLAAICCINHVLATDSRIRLNKYLGGDIAFDPQEVDGCCSGSMFIFNLSVP